MSSTSLLFNIYYNYWFLPFSYRYIYEYTLLLTLNKGFIMVELVKKLSANETEYRVGERHYIYNSSENKLYTWNAFSKEKIMIKRDIKLEDAKKIML